MSGQSKGRTYSPFSRRRQNGRRFGVPPAAFEELNRQIDRADATVDRLRSQFPDMEVHYGNKETLEEKRFPWLRRMRQR